MVEKAYTQYAKKAVNQAKAAVKIVAGKAMQECKKQGKIVCY